MSLDAFPVFKPFQALTAEHLNDLREYLDHEDKITRRALIGIGVMCGFELDVDSSGRVMISKGAAVTSEGFAIASGPVVCDRVRRYEAPIPTGDDVSDAVIAEAQYPPLFPGGSQIDAWEMLTVEVQIPSGEPAPQTLTPAFLADKTVMLFLECTEESLRNCDVNDCSDKGAQLQFALRRLLIPRAAADRIMAREAEIAGFPTDRAEHPGLALKYLRVEDLGLARLGIGAFPGLIGRILQIALRLSTEAPGALRALWAAYGHLMRDMYPQDEFPDGPFPDDYFGNVWGQFFAQPFLAQQFHGYMLDLAMACNETVAAARAMEAECLPDPERFPRHVLLGDPKPRPRGFVAEVSSAAEFAAWDPAAASSGFGPHPRPPRRRTPWTPARPGPALAEFRALFHRLTLLAHAFELRGLIGAEIRVTPSRHGAWPLGERCIPPHYAFDQGADLFRVWSPRKTRANLLNTVHAHRFSARDGNHPYLFRIDGEDFHAVAGHVGRDLAQVIAELAEHKRVLGLDFAVEPVWMGLAAADDVAGRLADEATSRRAMEAVRKLIFCRMGDFEVVLLGLLAALILFLLWLMRAVAGQRAVEFAPPRFTAISRLSAASAPPEETPQVFGMSLRPEAAEAMAGLAEREALRVSGDFAMAMKRLPKAERERIETLSRDLVGDVRAGRFVKGDAVRKAAPEAAGRADALGSVYVAVEGADAEGALFERVEATLAGSEATAGADPQRVYRAVALMDATETLIEKASARSLAELDAPGLETAYAGFADRLSAYAAVAPQGGDGVGAETAASNVAIADLAPAVSSQAGLLSGAGLFGEMSRRMEAIFESLTLEGYAARHPGLEHRGGAPAGGTLVLAYASKRELEALLRAGPKFGRATAGAATGASSIVEGLAAAAAEVAKVAGPPGADPLSEFVVLADFCLPSKCCDADCTDVALDDDARPAIFDLDPPGTMGVAPILPNGAQAAPRPADAVDRDLEALFRELGVGGPRPGAPDAGDEMEDARRRAERAAAEAAAAEAERARLARETERAAAEAEARAEAAREAARQIAERLEAREREEEAARRAEEEAARRAEEEALRRAAERAEAEARRREAEEARRRETEAEERRRAEEEEEERRRDDEERRPTDPGRPTRDARGVLAGAATGAGRLASTPVPGAKIVATAADGREAARLTSGDDGSFKAALPAGSYEIAAEADGFQRTVARVEIAAGETSEIALRMKRAPGG